MINFAPIRTLWQSRVGNLLFTHLSEDSNSSPSKKCKVDAYEMPSSVRKLIEGDKPNRKLWEEARIAAEGGQQVFYPLVPYSMRFDVVVFLHVVIDARRHSN